MSKHLGTLTLDMLVNLNGFKQGLKSAEQQSKSSSEQINRHFKSTVDASFELEHSIGHLSTAMTALATTVSVSNIVQFADSYTNLNNKLKLVTHSQGELQIALDATFRIAQDVAISWQSVNDVYAKFAQNADKLKLSQQDLANMTATVTKAVSMSGASTESANAALMQFGQALSAGALRGEELNSVMEQTPALAKAIADGMGVSVGELRNLAKEGVITADVLVDALKKVAPQIETEYAKTATTISDSFNRIRNEMTKSIGELDANLGISNVTVAGVTLLAENLEMLGMIAGGVATVFVSRYVGALVAATSAGYAKMKQKAQEVVVQQSAVAQTIRESQATIANTQATLSALAVEKALELERMKAQVTQAGMIASATRMAELRRVETLATTELAIANKALSAAQAQQITTGTMVGTAGRALLGVLGGPVGLAVMVATLGASYVAMKKSASEATKELDIQASGIEELVDKYKNLNETQKRSEADRLNKTFRELDVELYHSKNSLESYLRVLSNNNDLSKQAQQEVSELNRLWQFGKISTDELATRINALNGVSAKYKEQVDASAAAISTQEGHVNNLQSRLDVLTKKTQLNTVANHDNASSIDRQVSAMSSLNSEVQKFIGNQKLKMAANQYQMNLIQNHRFPPELAQRLAIEFERNGGRMTVE